MYELEKRTLISDKEYTKLNSFLELNAKFLGIEKRFTMVYWGNSNFIEAKDDQIDLRVRVINKIPQIVLKHGNWHDSSARREFEVDFELDKFGDIIHILFFSGRNYGIVTMVTRKKYEYQDLTITLDDYFEYKDKLMEVECLFENKKDEDIGLTKILNFTSEHNLNILNDEETLAFIGKINKREELKFDFKKEDIDDWIKKNKRFIECDF